MASTATPLHPQVRRELIDLLYTALPPVAAITATAFTGAAAMAWIRGDAIYWLLAGLIGVVGFLRLLSLKRYPRSRPLSPAQVLFWERLYALGGTAFASALGLLSLRALQLGDHPGAWISFGLSVSYCVGMVSRAAVRPWIVLVVAAALLLPTMIGGFLRPEPLYKLGAGMLFLFWIILREASRHLSRAFIERIEAKRALAHQAMHDPLTGLANRSAFLAAIEALPAQGHGSFALIAIDLDRFKPVNDQFGHRAGDELLKQVGERLQGCVQPHGMAVRMGGDEFTLLLPFAAAEPDAEAALRVARQAVKLLGRPFQLPMTVTIGASAGIALSSNRQPIDATRVLDRVDAALYAAKNAGGGRWHWADDEAPAEAAAA